MPNRVNRILESIKTNAGNDVYQSIISICGTLDEKVTPRKQSDYLKLMLCELEKKCTTDTVINIMKPCGYQCISDNMIKRAKALYVKSRNLEDFLRLLNERRIGGGRLHIKNDKIIGIYERCYCGLARSVKGLSPLYCNCSAGWYERLFSSIFKKTIKVKIVQTILDGSNECVFEISS
jgi:predicted hydrocarbon binding protein